MIAVLTCGRAETAPFAGRNTFPLLGRPMMVYPLLAGLHSKENLRSFLSTDSDQMARIGEFYGVEAIARPQELQGPNEPVESILGHGFQEISRRLGQAPEILVFLLANAPTVTSALVDQAILALRADASLDAVVTVTRRNDFAPKFAARLLEDGTLAPHTAEPTSGSDAYFPDFLLWAIRPERFWGSETPLPPGVVDLQTQRVGALVHEGYGDVDQAWQIPAVEAWLRKTGFTETKTPYDRPTATGDSGVVVSAGREDWLGRIRSVPATQRVLVTTIPFAEADAAPLRDLEQAGAAVVINPLGRKLSEADLGQLIGEFGVVVAGTEPITNAVMARAPHLSLISRVGIGLDNVDLQAARARKIAVSYTPDAPAPAVAELTVGLMLDLLRGVSVADHQVRNGVWHRFMGRRLSEMTVGIIGVGRVGQKVIRHLRGGFPSATLLANDLRPDLAFGHEHRVDWLSKEEIFRRADVISLHLPLTPLTRNLITLKEIALMRSSTLLINTSRGGVISEADLKLALEERRIAGAALDVFEHEPYSGPLCTVTNALLTCHMGSMSRDCRARMEREAVDEVLRLLKGERLLAQVPEEEYACQSELRR